MNDNSTFGFKGFAMLFAFLVIGFAGAQSQPGGQFDLLTKVVRKNPTKTTSTTGTTTGTLTGTTTTTTTSTSNLLYTELTAIPSTFDVNTNLIPAWGTGAIAGTMAPDDVGAFRFICGPGQLLKDDPIAYPGQPGASHLHQFYGNLGVNANSTYSSLRASGPSTCEYGSGKAVNGSGYWMPAMLDGKGNAVRPDFVSIYYKRYPISSPRCGDPGPNAGDPYNTKTGPVGKCVPLPNGLRYIFGYDMLTNKVTTGGIEFNCDGPTATGGHYKTITEAMKYCPTTPTPTRQWNGVVTDVYNRLGVIIHAPACWNGTQLDSPNHRDHVSDLAVNGYTGQGYCPPDHPFLIPSFSLGAWFRVDENLGTWRLSSDEMVPGAAPGSTFHADWFGAWDNQIEAMWMDNCINKLLSCSGGDLGNGKQLRGASGPLGWEANPRLVPVSS